MYIYFGNSFFTRNNASLFAEFLHALIRPFINKYKAENFYVNLFTYTFVFFLLLFFHNISCFFLTTFPEYLRLIDKSDSIVLFRSSMVIQSMYVFVSLIFFCVTENFHTLKWDKYFLMGAYFLCAYGFHEIIYSFAKSQSSDFLSNCKLGENMDETGIYHQKMTIGAVTFERFKFLT